MMLKTTPVLFLLLAVAVIADDGPCSAETEALAACAADAGCQDCIETEGEKLDFEDAPEPDFSDPSKVGEQLQGLVDAQCQLVKDSKCIGLKCCPSCEAQLDASIKCTVEETNSMLEDMASQTSGVTGAFGDILNNVTNAVNEAASNATGGTIVPGNIMDSIAQATGFDLSQIGECKIEEHQCDTAGDGGTSNGGSGSDSVSHFYHDAVIASAAVSMLAMYAN